MVYSTISYVTVYVKFFVQFPNVDEKKSNISELKLIETVDMLALHNSVHFECVNYIEIHKNQVELVVFSLALR